MWLGNTKHLRKMVIPSLHLIYSKKGEIWGLVVQWSGWLYQYSGIVRTLQNNELNVCTTSETEGEVVHVKLV